MFKQIIKRGLLGFIAGVFIGQSFLLLNLLLLNIKTYSVTLHGQFTNYLVSGIIGLMFSATSIIFEIDKWSLTKQTVIHFLITSIVMYLCYVLGGWLKFDWKNTLIWFAVFIVIYLIFWIIFYLSYRKKVKEINEYL